MHFRKQVAESKKDAVKDGVTVPTTVNEYCIMAKPRQMATSGNMDDFYDDDYMEDDDDDDYDNCAYEEDEDDSGHGDS